MPVSMTQRFQNIGDWCSYGLIMLIMTEIIHVHYNIVVFFQQRHTYFALSDKAR